MKKLFTALLIFAITAAGIEAQSVQNTDSRRAFATRAELDELLDVLNGTLLSPVYSDTLKGIARADAEVVRARLSEGDFRVGDRILISVETDVVAIDTVTVSENRILELPAMGDFSLRGILRAELEDTLTVFIGSFLRDPVVRVSPLIRILVTGAVGRQGFYTVPSNILLSDVIMGAGGPDGNSVLNEVRIERNAETLVRPEAVRAAFIAGSTLDQLGVRDGDHIVIPLGGGGAQGLAANLRSFTILLSLPASIFALTRLF